MYPGGQTPTPTRNESASPTRLPMRIASRAPNGLRSSPSVQFYCRLRLLSTAKSQVSMAFASLVVLIREIVAALMNESRVLVYRHRKYCQLGVRH
jgi:hypothetical protein